MKRDFDKVKLIRPKSILTEKTEAEIRQIAREGYVKLCINRPHMPDPDSDEGQRTIDRLFDIMAQPFREGGLR